MFVGKQVTGGGSITEYVGIGGLEVRDVVLQTTLGALGLF